ncbi:hypothetical protein [Candidatus Villigracilis saccharophilus]|uniref:hypothetical protein n=1 Tax=Candidatus Villigracilis saccharophilus TaxID=3140684 RepID=UPI003135969F|nr:hypothetical protein [Anaerolineales bacterium]
MVPHRKSAKRSLGAKGPHNCDICNRLTNDPPTNIAIGDWSISLISAERSTHKSQKVKTRTSFFATDFDVIVVCDVCVKKELNRYYRLDTLLTILMLPMLIFFFYLFFPFWLLTKIFSNKNETRHEKYIRQYKSIRYIFASQIAQHYYGNRYILEADFKQQFPEKSFPIYHEVYIDNTFFLDLSEEGDAHEYINRWQYLHGPNAPKSHWSIPL